MTPDEPDEPYENYETDVDTLHVRRADHDIAAFASRIVAQIAAGDPVIVDLPWSERGNVIHLRRHRAGEL